MAKGTKTGGRDFPKGVSGNPNGRPPVPADVQALRRLTQGEVERIANELLEMSKVELTEVLKNPETPAKVAMFARLIRSAIWSADHKRMAFLLDRIVGKVGTTVQPGEGGEADPAPAAAPTEAPVPLTFEEFCVKAGYPSPYPKQVEMMAFGMEGDEPRLLLGARGYGKSDYVTILGIAYEIYLDWFAVTYQGQAALEETNLIVSKSRMRNTAMLEEIANALKANDVPLEKQNSTCLRVQGLIGKDHSVEVITIKGSFRGRHPKRIAMDDPVTEEDTSDAMRTLVKKKYDEAYKLCKNIVIIGQPAHAFDLYAELRDIVKKLEIPHGSIPELDADLEAMKLAGVDERSIEMSYRLRVPADAGTPFSSIKYLDNFPQGDSVAFIDPSFTGGDYTALSIARGHFDGVAIQGHLWKQAWNHCLPEMVERLRQYGVRRLCIETNSLGDLPVLQLREALKDTGIGVVGKASTSHKHSRIMAAGSYAHLIHLSKTSDRLYTEHVVKYEYGAKFDDGPDSMASLLEWLGLIHGKGKS